MTPPSAFERLHPRVQRWAWTQGWPGLRDAQERAVAPILAGDRDLVIAAATAAGKTEAAFLPIASRLIAEPAESIQALYLSPLKALINDQHRRLEEICRDLELDVHRWHGDVDSEKKRKLVEDPRGVLLITPESLEALFVLRGTRLRAMFEHLAYVVVDEMHAFLGIERGRQLQSLLHRLELVLRRRVPRIGLSATLGDMGLACEFLRPGGGADVETIESRGGGGELKLQLRAYEELAGPGDDDEGASGGDARAAVAAHLFETLRGKRNLVFANGRREVELVAARLRSLCEEARLPNEFFAHHGSLARALREEVETALRDPSLPRTVVCTSTLEMGLDVGDVESVAQIGAPPSVAALRQRLGRSGRRGAPAVLRLYVRERALGPAARVQDRLREELVQAVAMVELLLEGWCEPPETGELHLSTLVQQVLSTIAQHSGVRADQAYESLCATGPFRNVDAATFAELLRAMGRADLVTQDAQGLLLTGLAGEREVADYRFFAAFQTGDEYRVLHEGRELGTVPLRTTLVLDAGLVLAGRHWRVREVDETAGEIHVVPGSAGDPPIFEGGGGLVHDAVRARMRHVLGGDGELAWLNRGANRLLGQARRTHAELDLGRRRVLADGRDAVFLPWAGDRVMNTLFVALSGFGAKVVQQGMALRVEGVPVDDLWRFLGDLDSDGVGDPVELAAHVANPALAKYDALLPDELLARDHASRALDVEGARAVVRAALEGA